MDDSRNLMVADTRSRYRLLSQSTVWWIGAAAACLGLLLLTVILSLVAQNGGAIRHGNKPQVCLMECENLVYNLTKDKDALRDERDQLRINASNLTKAIEVLQSQYNTVSASRDKLQEDVRRLNVSREDQLCPQGLMPFNNKCYFASAKGAAKTWEDSRKDCLERRADLVIITTKEELDFVTNLCSRTWIGLSDTQQEGKWKWVDGTDLVGVGNWHTGEPNDIGNEDCVEISPSDGKWNDVPCTEKLSWICMVP
ncbi:C-type lectin domain family 4 member E [Scophthalmus maximus]|uniref:C-type lectin domain family 4 member E n=1 Tax=Scophthalmus maximus TaxID=52904 RepID=A0A2U9AZ95_SCOMX|nr:CD209 antigen-like protein E [Scophthalmus maximus]AWO96891.1 C-type lectin domain family 4 member E [Scophthalmus maximus]